MSSIIRRRSGLTVLVSLIGRSFLSEVERPSILRTGLPVAPTLSYRLATRPLGSRPRAAGRSGATSCPGASLPYRQRALAIALDRFATPSGNGHDLRLEKAELSGGCQPHPAGRRHRATESPRDQTARLSERRHTPEGVTVCGSAPSTSAKASTQAQRLRIARR